jgi:hypothetical protein
MPCCGLAAHTAVSLPLAEVAALRKRPPAIGSRTLPLNLVRNADEQTVVALAAIGSAVAASALAGPFTDWGAVAGPRFAGRLTVAAQVPRFLAEGAWGVSPQVVPHHALHAVSGAISQALALHGPNFGAGGGPGAAGEALVTALALLESMSLPGVWLACTRLTPEGPLDDAGQPVGECRAEAVALALVPTSSPLARRRLEWAVGELAAVDFPELVGVGQAFLPAIPEEAGWKACPTAPE